MMPTFVKIFEAHLSSLTSFRSSTRLCKKFIFARTALALIETTTATRRVDISNTKTRKLLC